MRATLVVELIRAHYDAAEDRFKEIVEQIAFDEEKKGNSLIAKQIRQSTSSEPTKNVLSKKKTATSGTNFLSTASLSASITSFSTGGTLPLACPKDKDSSLDLIEWIHPGNFDGKVILSEDISTTIENIVFENQDSTLLDTYGLKATNRVLLCGPPGCGKTSTAHEIANRLNLPMAYVRLDALISSFLGQTGNNIRKIFDAVEGTRSVLFLDEFDAIAKKRDDDHELGELKRVVTTLLQNFDLLSDDVILIAATNHEHLLDDAIWRRFNQIIRIDLPNQQQREQILKIGLEKFPLSRVNWNTLTNVTQGMNCSILSEICLQTAKRALIHERKSSIDTDDVAVAIIRTIAISEGVHLGEATNIIVVFARRLRERGFSLRSISKATGIPKSTLSDYLNEV